MPILRRRRREADSAPPPAAKVEERSTYRIPPAGAQILTPAGEPVDLESALRSAAVFACQRVLVATGASLPIDVVRGTGDTRRPLPTAAHPLIVRNPSGHPSIRRRAWVGQTLRSLVGASNLYADIVDADPVTGAVTQLEVLDPTAVQWRRADGRVLPHVGGQRRYLWPEGDLWHVPVSSLMLPGRPFATPVVDFASTSIGTAIAAEKFGARFFGDGAHPTAILKNSDPDLDETQATAAKAALQNIMRGSRETLVLGSAWSLDQWQIDPKDSQFVDLMRFEVEQACRWFGVPPSMVYSSISGQAVTYANVTDADLSFLKYSLAAWLVDLEDAWSELLPASDRVRFNVEGLLRMDALKRAKLEHQRLIDRTTTVNEVRRRNDEEPFGPEFDVPGVPGVAGDAPDAPGADPETHPHAGDAQP